MNVGGTNHPRYFKIMSWYGSYERFAQKINFQKFARVHWPGLRAWAQALFGRGNPMATSNLKLLLEHKASPWLHWAGGLGQPLSGDWLKESRKWTTPRIFQMYPNVMYGSYHWSGGMLNLFEDGYGKLNSLKLSNCLRWGSTPVVTILGSEVAKKSAMGFSNGSCLGISRYFPMVLRPWWTAGRGPVDKWQRSAC